MAQFLKFSVILSISERICHRICQKASILNRISHLTTVCFTCFYLFLRSNLLVSRSFLLIQPTYGINYLRLNLLVSKCTNYVRIYLSRRKYRFCAISATVYFTCFSFATTLKFTYFISSERFCCRFNRTCYNILNTSFLLSKINRIS